jgi:tripartite-type tricarboxylate transporter receptor subunit TctC
MITNRQFRQGLLAALVCGTGLAHAAPTTGPWKADRPVTIVVPYAAGGNVDGVARAVAKSLTAATGQPVVVENYPGADGLIGTRRVMDAAPDGYTLLLQVPALTVTRHLPGLKGIDPVAGLAPVSSILETPTLVVGTPKLPVQNLREFVQHCQKAAEPCSAGAGEALGRVRAKILAGQGPIPNLISVNYRGTNPIITDLLAGRVSLSFINIPSVLPHYKEGKLKVLAVQDTKRSPLFPDVPTVVEMGLPQLLSVTWFGLFAPKNTPPAVLNGIHKALLAAKDQPDLQRTATAGGATLMISSPAEFAKQVKQDEKVWGEVTQRYPFE